MSWLCSVAYVKGKGQSRLTTPSINWSSLSRATQCDKMQQAQDPFDNLNSFFSNSQSIKKS